MPHIRKSLVIFPWILEYNAETLRHCDDYDPKTGKPVKATCHYDKDGKELHSAHIANVLTTTGSGTFNPCTKGYEGTKRYTPNGEPIDGQGARQKNDAEPATSKCTTSPHRPELPQRARLPERPALPHGGLRCRALGACLGQRDPRSRERCAGDPRPGRRAADQPERTPALSGVGHPGVAA